MRTNKFVSLAAAAAASALLLAGCSSTPAPTGEATAAPAEEVVLTKDVHLVVGTSASEGAFFTESGIFDDAPYTIDWSYITDWGAIYSSIASDALNVGFWGLDANIFKAVQNGVGAKLVSLLGADPSATESGTLNVFVRTDAGIDSTSDLAGKTVATGSAGTTFDNVLSAAIADGGLTADDLNIVRFPDSDQTSIINTFLNGDAQVFAGNISSQQIIDALDAGTIKVLYWQNQFLPINRIVVSNAQTLSDPAKAAALQDFVQRVGQEKFWESDPSNKSTWVEISSAATKLPVPVAEQVYEYVRNSTLPQALDDATKAKLKKTIDAFVSFGILTEPVALEDVLDTRYADAIAEVIAQH